MFQQRAKLRTCGLARATGPLVAHACSPRCRPLTPSPACYFAGTQKGALVSKIDIFRRAVNGKSVIPTLRVTFVNGETSVLGAVIGGGLSGPTSWGIASGERILELRLWFTSTTPDVKVGTAQAGRSRLPTANTRRGGSKQARRQRVPTGALSCMCMACRAPAPAATTDRRLRFAENKSIALDNPSLSCLMTLAHQLFCFQGATHTSSLPPLPSAAEMERRAAASCVASG
jgi:hypothetical protein